MSAIPNDCVPPERARIGDWGVTVSGKQFWPADPRLGDIDIEDIAHHLSMQCRFVGATRDFYSVAQHSVLVSKLVPDHLRVVGLLHDATEAYLHDIIKPLKKQLTGYAHLENLWAVCIGLTFGVELLDLPREVHAADRAVLVAERRDLISANAPWKFPPNEAASVDRIDPWEPDRARREFLWHWRLYRGGK